MWIGSVFVLALMALGVTQLNAKGLSDADYILDDNIGSKIGTQIVDRHFPGGGSNPAVLIAKAPQAQQVAAAAAAVPGVAQVVPYTGAQDGGNDGQPKVVNGLVQYNVILDANPQSQEAQAAVERLRDAVHAVPGADAMVGGATAIALDFNTTAAEDRGLLPLLLLVVLVVVAILLRALIAPILLVATVVLSYLAAIGVSALVFEYIFGFPGVDSTFPLHTFVFLVALGVDYNIFLITRVHEESIRHGTKQGVLIGLQNDRRGDQLGRDRAGGDLRRPGRRPPGAADRAGVHGRLRGPARHLAGAHAPRTVADLRRRPLRLVARSALDRGSPGDAGAADGTASSAQARLLKSRLRRSRKDRTCGRPSTPQNRRPGRMRSGN